MIVSEDGQGVSNTQTMLDEYEQEQQKKLLISAGLIALTVCSIAEDKSKANREIEKGQ